jgi:large subunit ribosomal protein L7/L12
MRASLALLLRRAGSAQQSCSVCSTSAASGRLLAPGGRGFSTEEDQDASSIGNEKTRQLAEDIMALSVLEASWLSEILRKRLNIQKPAFGGGMPMMMAPASPAPAAAAADAPAAEEKKEKTEFAVKLEGFTPEGKIKVIKEIRAITNLGLKEAKEMVGALGPGRPVLPGQQLVGPRGHQCSAPQVVVMWPQASRHAQARLRAALACSGARRPAAASHRMPTPRRAARAAGGEVSCCGEDGLVEGGRRGHAEAAGSWWAAAGLVGGGGGAAAPAEAPPASCCRAPFLHPMQHPAPGPLDRAPSCLPRLLTQLRHPCLPAAAVGGKVALE